MQQDQHVWVDGSLRDGPYYAQVMADLRAPASRGNRARDSGPSIRRRRRERYPHYRLAIFYVTCSEATARRRAKARAERTGRAIPEALFLESLAAPDASLRLLTPHVDFLARMSNEVDGAPPYCGGLPPYCDESPPNWEGGAPPPPPYGEPLLPPYGSLL